MNNTRKSQVIGYLFLIGATVLEIVLFCNIFDTELNNVEIISTILIPTVFNFAIWCLAITYNKTRDHCEQQRKDGNSTAV